LSKILADESNQNACQSADKRRVFNELEQMFIKNETIALRPAEPDDAPRQNEDEISAEVISEAKQDV